MREEAVTDPATEELDASERREFLRKAAEAAGIVIAAPAMGTLLPRQARAQEVGSKLSGAEAAAVKYLMCSKAALDLIARNQPVALKYIMCSGPASRAELSPREAVAIKYLMCSKLAEDSLQRREGVALKYIMCSRR
jgi:hypothetical protein